jgi:hypothetical protein
VRTLLGMDRRAWYRLHVCHLGTGLLAEVFSNRNQAIKKPGLN